MLSPIVESLLASLPVGTVDSLLRLEQRWFSLRHQPPELPKQVVQNNPAPLDVVEWDVLVCGGTLGIVIACALAQRGWRVLLLEQGRLQGRQQEWNISRAELMVLVELELLSPEQLDDAIATQFNPLRIQFHNHPAIWIKDVLNIGISPVVLLDILKQRFLASGGHLLEHSACQQVTVHPNGVAVTTPKPLTARLLLDVMGHGSPLVQQARAGQRPDSVCLVVGTCAQGIPDNETGDLIVTNTPIQNHSQYFWEAFPAQDGRTTYLFTYADLAPQRPSFNQLFTDYFQQLPAYQGAPLAELHLQRALFGLFPSYRQSPLRLPWDRTLAIGDSSGSQSPLSFGGFGALMRHLRRLVQGIDDALNADSLSQADLALLHPYQPNLSATWLFQQSMRAPLTPDTDIKAINQLLSVVFQEMAALGEPVLKPFLQDVVQFPGLSQTLWQVSHRHPAMIPQILTQLGPLAVARWLPHYLSLGCYHQLHQLVPLWHRWIAPLPVLERYRWQRRLEGWTYGSGNEAHG